MNETTHASVDTRNRHERARRATATVHDIQLGTANIELGAAVRRCDVESDLVLRPVARHLAQGRAYGPVQLA